MIECGKGTALRLRSAVRLFTEYTEREPEYVKTWLMWSIHFSPMICD